MTRLQHVAFQPPRYLLGPDRIFLRTSESADLCRIQLVLGTQPAQSIVDQVSDLRGRRGNHNRPPSHVIRITTRFSAGPSDKNFKTLSGALCGGLLAGYLHSPQSLPLFSEKRLLLAFAVRCRCNIRVREAEGTIRIVREKDADTG